MLFMVVYQMVHAHGMLVPVGGSVLLAVVPLACSARDNCLGGCSPLTCIKVRDHLQQQELQCQH